MTTYVVNAGAIGARRLAAAGSLLPCLPQALSALSGLQHLGISNTSLRGEALLALVGRLPALRHLDLRNSQLADEHLLQLPQVDRPFIKNILLTFV